jgi:hypothetical protein
MHDPDPSRYRRPGVIAGVLMSAIVVLPAFRVPSCGCGTRWCEFPGQYVEIPGIATPFLMPFVYLGAFVMLQFTTERPTRAGMRALAVAGALLTATFAYVASSPSALVAIDLGLVGSVLLTFAALRFELDARTSPLPRARALARGDRETVAHSRLSFARCGDPGSLERSSAERAPQAP